jgi:CopG family nickel-responsive transcriptional regulator
MLTKDNFVSLTGKRGFCNLKGRGLGMAITRFGISLERMLLEKFDNLIEKKGYANRSEAIRDLIRDSLVQEEWESSPNNETVGTITIVYSHDTRELADKLTDIQHHHHDIIISTMHVHLDEHNCLEVIAVKGKAKDIKAVADRLIGTKGVKHGKLTLTTTGRDLK